MLIPKFEPKQNRLNGKWINFARRFVTANKPYTNSEYFRNMQSQRVNEPANEPANEPVNEEQLDEQQLDEQLDEDVRP